MRTDAAPIMEKTNKEVIQKSLSRAISYGEYRQLVAELASEGRSTGLEQTEALSNYTLLNDKRMKRFDKTLKVDENTIDKIKSIRQEITFLVLTESWCGDAAPALPVMNKIAALNPNISFKIVLRDENLELMKRFLTDGAMSIPKLILLEDSTKNVLGDWGPRPGIAAKMADDYKEEHGKLTPEFKQGLQLWYNKDKGQHILQELLQLLALE